MDDLISRREAIEAVEHITSSMSVCVNTDECHGMKRMQRQAVIELTNLPSAQPKTQLSTEDATFGTTFDCISRQAAIDALCKACANGEDYLRCRDRDIKSRWCDTITALRDLPSAQTERTCVNCGRTANNGGWYADGRTRCPIEEHYALPKNGYCHLWEKRNVTDDDYPERREDERPES